jgi:hypothetical protein
VPGHFGKFTFIHRPDEHPLVMWASEMLPEAEATKAALDALPETTGKQATEEAQDAAMMDLQDFEEHILVMPARTLGDRHGRPRAVSAASARHIPR